MTLGKVRVSVWVDPELWFLAKQDAISFSALMDEVLSSLYGLDPAPDKELFREKKEKMKSRVLNIYQDKLAARSQDKERAELLEKKTREKMESLKQIGELLQKSKFKKALLSDLQKKTLDQEESWEKFNYEVQKKLKNGWTSMLLYNQCVEWWRLYGGITHG